MRLKNKIINKLSKSKSNEKTLTHILCLIIGIVTALLAIGLKTIVHYTSQLVKTIVNIDSANIFFVITPLIGIGLTILFVKFVIKDSLAHGITKVLFAISKQKSNIATHNNYSSIVASTLTVGFGGSVGLEAPIVLTGASIGSTLGKSFNLNYKTKTLLLGCGAAAAIASIFKAPIAGTIFALEVLMLDLSIASIIPLLISAVTASLISTLLLGHEVVFNFAVFEPFVINKTPFYILLGLFCGAVGLYFTAVLEFIETKFVNKIKHPLIKLLIGGVSLSILIYFIPPLYGEGYDTLSNIFNYNTSDIMLHSYFFKYSDKFALVAVFFTLIIVFKAFASAVTTGAGGVGGVFAPSLFLGGVTGFLFSNLINNLLNTNYLSQRNFALVGMAGVLSAVMQSPLTAIFLIAEITGGYELLVPIIITSTTAFITIHRFEKFSIYTKKLAKRDELITHNKDQAILTLIKFRELLENDFIKINYNGFLADLITEMPNFKRNIFVVVDNDELKGLIDLNDISEIIFNTKLYDKITIKSLVKPPKDIIYTTDTPEEVMLKFKNTGAWNLPVLEDGKYIGFLSRSKIMTSYHDLLIELSYNISEK